MMMTTQVEASNRERIRINPTSILTAIIIGVDYTMSMMSMIMIINHNFSRHHHFISFPRYANSMPNDFDDADEEKDDGGDEHFIAIGFLSLVMIMIMIIIIMTMIMTMIVISLQWGFPSWYAALPNDDSC